MTLRTVGVKLTAEVSGYMSGIRQARGATRDFVGELDKAARAGRLDAVADQATMLGAGLVGAFGLAAGAAAKFDKQMSSVQAATRASTTELELLRNAAMQAGKDTSYSATEAAQAVEELAKAGVSTGNILGGGLTGALNLAAAGQMDVAEAAETAASAMTQFKLAGSEVPHIADLLAAGAGKAQGSVHDMGMALNQAGLVSAQMGLTIEDTVGTLTSFASAGLLGSDAGTSLKTALLMLANPSKEAATLMAKLGINAYDAQGNFVGITALAGQLQTQLGGLTQEQRNAAMATIFGADAIRAASILYEQGADGVQKWVGKVDDQGYAADTARMKTDNLIGDLERLRGELDNLAIQAGSGSSGGLRWLTQAAEGLVAQIGSLPPAISSTAVGLTGLAGVAMLLGAGWVRARRSNAEMLGELRETGPAGQRAARGLEVAQRGATRAAGAFIALQVAGAAIGAMQKDLNPQVEALGKGLAEWGQSGRLAGESARVLGADLADLGVGLKFLADTDNGRRQFVRWGQDILETVVPGLDGTNTSLTRTRERVQAMDQALAGLVQSGSASQAEAAFLRLAEAAEKDGVSIEELQALFPTYAGAVETAGSATSSAAGQIGGLGGSASEAAEQVTALKDAFDKLFGQRMDLDTALLAYKRGIADVNAELKDGTRTLDINKAAGQDNIESVLKQIDVINDLRQSRIDHNMSLDEANGKYVKDIDGLRNTMLQLGFNKKAVDELIGKYRDIPGEVSTDVSAPGAQSAKKQAEDFNFAVRSVPPSKTVPFWATTAEAKAAVNALKAKIDSLKNKHIYISGTVRWTSTGDLKVPGGTQLKNRWGGLYEHAEVGLLRDAQIASPRGPARYAWAEPATGGELFAPRFGDMARTRALVGYAIENWWGGWGSFAPNPGRGGSTLQLSPGPVSSSTAAPAAAAIGGADLTVHYLLRELVAAVERVAPGVGEQLTGSVSSARQLSRAQGRTYAR
ncbi:phage tail tape measure protein [Micromonospora sp. NPDC003944]